MEDKFNEYFTLHLSIISNFNIQHFKGHCPLLKIKGNINRKSWITSNIKEKQSVLLDLRRSARVAPTLQKLARQVNKSLKIKVICGKQSLIDSKFEQSPNLLRSTWQIVINELYKNNV